MKAEIVRKHFPMRVDAIDKIQEIHKTEKLCPLVIASDSIRLATVLAKDDSLSEEITEKYPEFSKLMVKS